MSLSRLTPRAAELTEPAASVPPPDSPGSRVPRRKRLRLEEPGAAGWGLPLVPRLSEGEKEWALVPGPFRALLVPVGGTAERSPSAAGERPRPRRRRSSKGEVNGCWRSPLSPGLRAGARACRCSDAGPSDGDRARAGAGQLPAAGNGAGDPSPVRGGGGRQKDRGCRRHIESLLVDVTFCKETKPTPRDMKNRCGADSAPPSHKTENGISASTLTISTTQSQATVKMAILGDFRGSSTMPMPAFPTGLKRKMSPGYVREITEKKNDKNETYVREFTDVYWSQNRPNVKKQKLLGDKEIVNAENMFSECYESNHQSVSNQGIRGREKDLIGWHSYNHSSVKSEGRDPDRSFTLKPQNANWQEVETGPDIYIATRSEKSQSWDYDIRHCLRKNKENNWIVHNYKTKCENKNKAGEKLNLLQLSEIGFLSKEDDYTTKAMNTHKEQPNHMIGTLGSQKVLLTFTWLNGKEDNNNMLQLRCSTQKDFYLSNVLEDFITESFYFYKNISGNEGVNSILVWHEILKCVKQTVVQNLIIRNIYVNRKNNILSIYLQIGVSKPLSIVLKANIASLLNNFDSVTRCENDSKLEEGCIFWIMCLNYPKSIVENHTVYLGRTLTFSRPLGDTMKPLLEEKKLFKIENLVLMDFEDMNEISLTKAISYKSKAYSEQVMNVKNQTHYSANTVKIHVKSLPQFIQANYEFMKIYEINMHNQNLHTERKQEHNKISSSNFKCRWEDFFNVREQSIPTSHTEQTNPMIVTKVQNLGSLLSEIEAKKSGLILKEKEKVTTQLLTDCRQIHKDIKIEKEEKNHYYSIHGMFSVQPVSLMRKKENVEETKYVNQNNLADKNEYGSNLQESESANSKHFYPKNDSIECVKHQFETNLSVGNNDCFQDLTVKCLSTEVLTIAKDFEMKSKFDLVLEELRMFHEISKENEILSTVEPNNGQENYSGGNNDIEEVKMEIQEDLKAGTVNKICASSSLCDTIASPSMQKRHQCFKWGTVPRKGELEVPTDYCCLRTSEGESLYSTSEEGCEKPSPKRPALLSDELKEERINYLVKRGSNFSHGISRVLPLKTCSRPIRIGLSRKAKLQQLHPYLK